MNTVNADHGGESVMMLELQFLEIQLKDKFIKLKWKMSVKYFFEET